MFRQYLSPIVSKLLTSIKTFMQGLLIKQKPLRDLLVSSAYFGGSGQSPIVSCLTHQEVLRVLVTNGGMQLPFLAVTWRVRPYNERSAFSEHVPVYVRHTSSGALLLSM